MDKHEILEKSRREGRDEGVEHARDRGHKFGRAAMAVFFIIISVFCIRSGLDTSTLYMMFGIYGFASGLGSFRVDPHPVHMICAVGSLCFFITGLLDFIPQLQ